MRLHGMLSRQVVVDKKSMARKNNNRANQTTLTRWHIFKFFTNDDITNHEQLRFSNLSKALACKFTIIGLAKCYTMPRIFHDP